MPQSDGRHWSGWTPWTCQPIGVGGLAQMFPWPRRPHDFPCFGQFQGTPESVYTKSKLHHPIKMCGSCGSSVQCTSHATIFLLNINIWLYIHIFDYTHQWICGSDDKQMLACGSLHAAVISESHKPDHREGPEPQRRFEGWCT